MEKDSIVLMKASSELRKKYIKVLKQQVDFEGLSINEMLIMYLLYSEPAITTSRQLTDLLKVSKGLISRSIEHLIDLRFINCKIDESDRRFQHFYLQDIAIHKVEQFISELNRLNHLLMKDVSEEEIKSMKCVLDKMLCTLSNCEDQK